MHGMTDSIMNQYQKRLLTRAIERLYLSDKDLRPKAALATIYKRPPTLTDQINAILRVLSISNVDTYMAKCQSGDCLQWPGYKSQGYPQIKCSSSSKRFTVIQILAILFLDQPTAGVKCPRDRNLQRSCPNKSCVNILHYSYPTKNGQKASAQAGPLIRHEEDNV
jgi:hypothetical protein